MRILKVILLFVTCLLFSLPLSAQLRLEGARESKGLPYKDRRFTYRDRRYHTNIFGLRATQYHAVGAYVYGGYATMPSSSKVISNLPGGYDFRAGAIYEFAQTYLIVDVGLGVAFRSIKTKVSDYSYTSADFARKDPNNWATLVDDWGVPITNLRYDIEGRSDKMRQLAIQMPIMAGVHIGAFYSMAGFCLSLPIIQKQSASMLLTSRAHYDRYYGFGDGGYWQEMDNHGLRKQVPTDFSSSSVYQRFDVEVCAEVGYSMDFSEKFQLRFAAFAAYGLLNSASASADYSLKIPPKYKYDFGMFGYTPAWYSDLATNDKLHNLSVGVKITILGRFKESEKCILCGVRGVY